MFDLPAFPNAHRPVTSAAAPRAALRAGPARRAASVPGMAYAQTVSSNVYGPAAGAQVGNAAQQQSWQPFVRGSR